MVNVEVSLLHSAGHWSALGRRDSEYASNLSRPIVVCRGLDFVVHGIPPDGSCIFGAFVWAAQQQELWTTSDLLERAYPVIDETSVALFEFLSASDDLIQLSAAKMITRTTLSTRAPQTVLTL